MGQEIKVTKLEGDEGLFLGYKVKGFLCEEIDVGKSLRVLRTHRNDLEILGFFETSPVMSIEGKGDFLLVETVNSLYKVEYE